MLSKASSFLLSSKFESKSSQKKLCETLLFIPQKLGIELFSDFKFSVPIIQAFKVYSILFFCLPSIVTKSSVENFAKFKIVLSLMFISYKVRRHCLRCYWEFVFQITDYGNLASGNTWKSRNSRLFRSLIWIFIGILRGVFVSRLSLWAALHKNKIYSFSDQISTSSILLASTSFHCFFWEMTTCNNNYLVNPASKIN